MIVHSERSDRLAESSQLLLQACALVDTLFASVFAYRSRCYSRYHLSDLMFQQWTSEPDLLSSSRQLFETACDYMETSESSVEEEFRLLLQRLASHLFRIFNDRLQYLNLCVSLFPTLCLFIIFFSLGVPKRTTVLRGNATD